MFALYVWIRQEKYFTFLRLCDFLGLNRNKESQKTSFRAFSKSLSRIPKYQKKNQKKYQNTKIYKNQRNKQTGEKNWYCCQCDVGVQSTYGLGEIQSTLLRGEEFFPAGIFWNPTRQKKYRGTDPVLIFSVYQLPIYVDLVSKHWWVWPPTQRDLATRSSGESRRCVSSKATRRQAGPYPEIRDQHRAYSFFPHAVGSEWQADHSHRHMILYQAFSGRRWVGTFWIFLLCKKSQITLYINFT